MKSDRKTFEDSAKLTDSASRVECADSAEYHELGQIRQSGVNYFQPLTRLGR